MKVDYDKLAECYDRHRRGGGPYMPAVLEVARSANARHVLELAAGTGNNTAAFIEQYPARLVGLEISAGMLAKARQKGLPVRWVRACATQIPFAGASFDFIFGCYFLHYIHDLDTLFAECRRVLHEGAVAFITAPLRFIENHPMNAYFPSFARIDRARFQSEDTLADAMHAAGFVDVRTEIHANPPRPVDHEYAERVRNKMISTYELIPEDEFAAGIARLNADLEGKDALDMTVSWEALMVSARTP